MITKVTLLMTAANAKVTLLMTAANAVKGNTVNKQCKEKCFVWIFQIPGKTMATETTLKIYHSQLYFYGRSKAIQQFQW